MNKPNPEFEYLEVHQSKLLAITDAIGGIIDKDERVNLKVDFTPYAPPLLVHGAVTAQDVLDEIGADFFDELGDNQIAEYVVNEQARIENETIAATAVLSLYTAITMLSMQAQAMLPEQDEDSNDQLDVSAESQADPERVFANNYESASFREAHLTISELGKLTINDTHVRNSCGYEDSHLYTMLFSDNHGVNERTSMLRIADRVAFINRSVFLNKQSPTTNRVLEVFEGDHGLIFTGKIAPILIESARVSTDLETIDDMIFDVFTEYVGTSQEQEVEMVLDAVRQEAIGIRANVVMSSKHSMNVPSDDNLNDYLALLGIK